MSEAIWRISIDTDPAALVQLVTRGEGKRLLTLQMGQQRQTIQALEYPAVRAILLLTSVGLATREEASLPFQQEELGIWPGPDSRARWIDVRRWRIGSCHLVATNRSSNRLAL